MLYAIQEGFRAVRRSWGLVALLLLVNLSLAAGLAVPLAGALERDLGKTGDAARMMYGFDYAWWSRWSEAQTGWTSSFGPDILGVGFAFKNLDLLLKGQLPGGLFARAEPEDPDESDEEPLDPVILGLGVVYILVQTFLSGGILGVLRGAQGSWTVRGLVQGSGFYFGRFVRIALLALLADWVVFRLNAPFARWADHRALESVSEPTGLAWSLGRHALLLLALLFVHMLSCYAKVIVVLEERSSAVLAALSSLAFCLGNLRRAAGHYLSVVAMAVVLLLAWNALDGLWLTTGYKTQLATLALAQALVAGSIGLRLALLGGQVALYKSR